MVRGGLRVAAPGAQAGDKARPGRGTTAIRRRGKSRGDDRRPASKKKRALKGQALQSPWRPPSRNQRFVVDEGTAWLARGSVPQGEGIGEIRRPLQVLLLVSPLGLKLFPVPPGEKPELKAAAGRQPGRVFVGTKENGRATCPPVTHYCVFSSVVLRVMRPSNGMRSRTMFVPFPSA